jgi:HSP20 family protein
MGKLVHRRKEKTEPPSPVSRAVTPFWPMRRLQSEIDRLFEEPFGSWLAPVVPSVEEWLPAVDVEEHKEEIVVKAELPGMKREEIELYLTGDNLNIAGERKVQKEEKTTELYRSERFFGRFHRSIPLPAAVDAGKIEAHYQDGVLTIRCPKTEEARQKQIDIKVD